MFKSSPNRKNWDPRFGFGWDPLKDRKTSVRGGFGIFHSRVEPCWYFQAFTSSRPYSFNRVVAPSFPNPFPAAPAPPQPFAVNGILYNLTHAPYQMEWSLSLQREIINSVLTLG